MVCSPESPGLMPEKRRSVTSVLWLTLSSGLLAFPGVTEQLASPTPEHQSVAHGHWALSMPASQERSWIWVRGSPKVRTRYWLAALLYASCWLETSLHWALWVLFWEAPASYLYMAATEIHGHSYSNLRRQLCV